METKIFEKLYELDVKDKVEQKNGLNYLSWSYAWAEAKKIDENANYTILKNDLGLPYVFDENTGYMVFTEMTINGITHSMFLPVMDGANKTMLNREYEYQVKEYKDGKATGNYLTKKVDKCSMFDINKTLMRCLTKNIAMFGLGLKLYQGEDLPSVTTKEEAENVVISFGKYAGKTLKEIKVENKNYLHWLLEKSKDVNIKTACELLIDEEKELMIQEGQLELIKELYADKKEDLAELMKKFKKVKITELTHAEAEELLGK